MPINGLTINQEKKIRADREKANGVSTSPYHLLAVAVAKYRKMQKGPDARKITHADRQVVIREIDFWLDKLDIK